MTSGQRRADEDTRRNQKYVASEVGYMGRHVRLMISDESILYIISTIYKNLQDCHPSKSSDGCEQGSRWLIESPRTYNTNLSVSCPYEIIVYFVLKHSYTTRMYTIRR